MLIDASWISGKVFYPRPSDTEPTLVVEVPGARLGCFLFKRYPEAGVLLHFHGNGELAAQYADAYAEWFLALGVNVCFAEYRGYGASTGTPALGEMLADGQSIVQALGMPPERIVAFGRSLGCVYAVELARRLPRLAGVILESGIADLAEPLRALVGKDDQFSRAEPELVAEINTYFDIKAILQGYKGRLLVLHAQQDHLLEPSHAERLHAWAGGSDKKLVLFPEGDHNSILFANYREYVAEVEAFLRRTGIATGRESKRDRREPGH
jgi:alpha-beta hydrolase superfamily lysophospholipase